MSDYFGTARLEDWLYEEVFNRVDDLKSPNDLPKEVVTMFEKWRSGVETSIEQWMMSDDGDGNPLSWRDWGRGFDGIPEEDTDLFESMVNLGEQYLLFNPVIDTCDHGHKFAKLKDHPTHEGRPHCPHCLALFFQSKRDGDNHQAKINKPS